MGDEIQIVSEHMKRCSFYQQLEKNKLRQNSIFIHQMSKDLRNITPSASKDKATQNSHSLLLVI